MQWLGYIADVIGILGAIFALNAWIQSRKNAETLKNEKKRQLKKVSVVLTYGGKSIELPVELRRSELTRAEVLGRLGMIPMKKKGDRFSLTYLNSEKFLRRINEITDGNGDSVLEISCTEEEFSQFDIGK